MPAEDWSIEVLDAGNNLVGIVGVWSGLLLHEKFNGRGHWEIIAPARIEQAGDLRTKGARVRFRNQDEVAMTGPMVEAFTSTSRDGVVSLTVHGHDDTAQIWDRDVWPDPTGNFSTRARDRRTGRLSTLLTGYVEDNMTANAGVPGRAVTGLTIGLDPLVGATETWSARFENLGEFLSRQAAGRVGFRIRDLSFEVYEPRDLSALVLFDGEGLGNVGESTEVIRIPDVTSVVVAGQGEGRDRRFVLVDRPAVQAAWNRRREWFRDRRDTDDVGELVEEGNRFLDHDAGEDVRTLQPVDTPALRYWRDYRVGDIVTTWTSDGTQLIDVVREATVVFSEDDPELVELGGT